MKTRIDVRSCQLVTMRTDERLDTYVASCVLSGYSGHCVISDLFVDPDYRRRGFGRQLMQNVIDQCDKPMLLLPRPSFDAAVCKSDLVTFYESLGFVELPDDDELGLPGFFRRSAGVIYSGASSEDTHC